MLAFLSALRDPGYLLHLCPEDWNDLLRISRQFGLDARLGQVLEDSGLLTQLPPKAQDHLADAIVACEYNQTKLLYEVERLDATLRAFDGPVVLLKGGAYLAAGLPPTRGRFSSDLDILVHEECLATVESALLATGWEWGNTNAYDQHYYRAWTHELPPLWHPGRQATMDVHHTILPKAGRTQPNAEALVGAAQELTGSRFHVLAPEDMVLHSAVHMIYNGTFDTALRDLVDLDDLLRHFEAGGEFWDSLVERARLHGVERPFSYALTLATRFLDTPVPKVARERLRTQCASLPIDRFVNGLFAAAVMPEDKTNHSVTADLARWLLYIRSHWMSMPPGLLLKHLAIKASRRSRAFLLPGHEVRESSN